jgi:hypothetical protein
VRAADLLTTEETTIREPVEDRLNLLPDPRHQFPAQLLTFQETTMRKLIVLAAFALVLAAGTATELTVQPQPAMACTTGNC